MKIENCKENYAVFTTFLKQANVKNLNIFFDIETFQYNYKKANEVIFKPTLLKNKMFSFAISFFYQDDLYTNIFNTSNEFFKLIEQTNNKKLNINLIANNNTRYDNHFIRYECINNLAFNNKILFNRNSIKHDREHKINDITPEEKERGIFLEKRVKTSNSLVFTILHKKVKYKSVDLLPKTSLSISKLGKKLLKLNLIDEKYLKTEMDYEKYNIVEDLTIKQANEYARIIFKNLNEKEYTYIENDVIILALGYKHYNDIYTGLDIDKLTLSSNILEQYKVNELANLQLINETENIKIDYSNFKFRDLTYYDYLLKFFKGGLNFYNQFYVGEIIHSKMFSMDLNSSYPYVMYKEKIPTFLIDHENYNHETTHIIPELDNNYYYLYTANKFTFNKIIEKIESILLRQTLVKYYNSKDNYIYFNTNTIRIIIDICKVDLKEIEILSYIKYECVYFGARNIIDKYYKVKSIGKCKYKMTMTNPFDYTIDYNQKNDSNFSHTEIDISKLFLNGIYGLPSLRKYFNEFYYDKDQNTFINYENNHENTSRNLLFSLSITSFALYNLLEPLKYLEPEEIDENLIYCDTDSLYLKKKIQHKLPSSLFDPYRLGAWDIENEEIKKFYVMNHKKYCYLTNEIKVKSGGVRGDSFNTNMSFKKFIETQFSNNIEIDTIKSIMNQEHTISIYPSTTKLKVGGNYPVTFNNYFNDIRDKIIEEVKKDNLINDDFMYIETTFGAISQREIYEIIEDITNTGSLNILKTIHSEIKKQLYT